jgi:formylglycine-generating enzyme required for sulfatase activity
MHQLPSADEFLNYSDDEKGVFCQRLEECLGQRFASRPLDEASGVLPEFTDKHSGLAFIFIPSGDFVMGLTNEEEQAARRICGHIPGTVDQMRPVLRTHVAPFLMTATPIITRDYARLVGLQDYQNPDFPAWITYEQASSFAKALGCRLPYEAEWEYACRAGTQTVFVWGNEVPPGEELEKWLNDDFSAGYENRLRSNRFGLTGLFMGEWCEDEFRSNHAPDGPLEHGEHVIKGGGSLFWPWQDEEWIWCMPAQRMSSSGLFEDRAASFRLVHEIVQEVVR